MKRTSLALQLLSGLGFLAIACGTDAVGVGECQRIESARCEAAAKCGSVDDLDACKRHFQDHCLHGLAVDQAPRAKAVTECVTAIKAAGSCASKHGAKTDPAECGATLKEADAKRVCEVVDEPERAQQCSFLLPDEKDEDKDEDEADETEAPDAGSKDSG
jgi:hypothetical protein